VKWGDWCLTSETVQGTALSLQRVDDVHGSDGLALGVFAVRDGVTNHVLKEELEHAPDLLVDETGDSLHSTTSGQPPDGRLGDALDVVTQDLSVALGAALSETFAAFSTSRHVGRL
jgi:hypothetical protein